MVTSEELEAIKKQSVNTNEKINAIRDEMKKCNIDAYIIPSADAHLSEFPPEYWRGRSWITGFIGSAGTFMVTMEKSILWVDSRYREHAEKQTQGSEIIVKNVIIDKSNKLNWELMLEDLKVGSVLGFDGEIFSTTDCRNIKTALDKKNIELNINYDLLENIWEDRPAVPEEKIFIHDIKYAGKTVKEKIKEVKQMMQEKRVDYYIISALDDIAWLFNFRGNDIGYNLIPVACSYAVLSQDKVYLFINPVKLSESENDYFSNNNVTVMDYKDIFGFLKQLQGKSTIFFDPEKNNIKLYDSIQKSCNVIEKTDIVLELKAIKNPVEIQNYRNTLESEAIVLTRFFCWLENSYQKKPVSEFEVLEKLHEIRGSMSELMVNVALSISASGANSSMAHYIPFPWSCIQINDGPYLLDTFAHYFGMTTDITRSFYFGTPTKEYKKDYTIILKSIHKLLNCQFPADIKGSQIDAILRVELWKHGLNYGHGTGHGVGTCLSIHEWPGGFNSDKPFKENMVTTIEPSILKEGRYGIRTENEYLVVKAEKTEFGQFLKFEDMTYIPVDLKCVNINMLDNDEINWLNDYNKKTYKKISPHINEEERKWLKENTKELKK